MAAQQPFGQPLLGAVQGVAGGGLFQLGLQGRQIGAEHRPDGRPVVGQLAQAGGVDAAGRAAHLGHVAGEGDLGHGGGQTARHALAADHDGFDRAPVLEHGHGGDDAMFDEIDLIDRVARLVEDMALSEVDPD